MSVLTILVPEGKHQSLQDLAKARGISVNKLIEKLSTVALAQYDVEMRVRALAARGSTERGLKLLDKLDRAFARNSRQGVRVK
jgi:hypothetical protein